MMKGYLDHRVIKGAIFYICTLCLLLAMIASVLAIWEMIGEEHLNQCLGTLAVIAFGSLLFLGLNLAFGSLEAPSHDSDASFDPAFGDRLKKAKDLRGQT